MPPPALPVQARQPQPIGGQFYNFAMAGIDSLPSEEQTIMNEHFTNRGKGNMMIEMMFTAQRGNTIPLRECGHLDMIGNQNAVCRACEAMPQDVGHTTYYDTERLPYGFNHYRFLASGNANWDYFLSPTCPWVYSIAKQPGCLSGSWGTLVSFLHMQSSRSPCADYLAPLDATMRQCQNPPIDTAIPRYRRPMACCPAQRSR